MARDAPELVLEVEQHGCSGPGQTPKVAIRP
jgi:hypothetical protein